MLSSIVENCPLGDAILRNKASEVHKFGLRLMPERYSKRRAPNDRPLRWDPKFALSRCHAEIHNRMLNTRPRTHSVSVTKINSCAVKLSLVVEHTRYNPSRSRRQLNQPAMAYGLSKDPSKTWKTREQRYGNFSDTEIVLSVAKPNRPIL